MLKLGSELLRFPVLSLHVGGEIAKTTAAVIRPEDLKAVAYTLTGPGAGGEHGDILLTDDVRELSQKGLIIDSADNFALRDEVVWLDKLMGLNFELVGLKVVSEDGKNLGKVSDYTLDTQNFTVYQIIVQRPVVKSLIDPELTINRSQIMEIDDYKITIRNEHEEVEVKEEKVEFQPNFVNPFREPQFSPIRDRNRDEVDTE